MAHGMLYGIHLTGATALQRAALSGGISDPWRYSPIEASWLSGHLGVSPSSRARRRFGAMTRLAGRQVGRSAKTRVDSTRGWRAKPHPPLLPGLLYAWTGPHIARWVGRWYGSLATALPCEMEKCDIRTIRLPVDPRRFRIDNAESGAANNAPRDRDPRGSRTARQSAPFVAQRGGPLAMSAQCFPIEPSVDQARPAGG
jgi:hypothetical protein